MERRNRWLLAIYVAIQVAIPTVALWVRWNGGPVVSKFGWHMFSTAG